MWGPNGPLTRVVVLLSGSRLGHCLKVGFSETRRTTFLQWVTRCSVEWA